MNITVRARHPQGFVPIAVAVVAAVVVAFGIVGALAATGVVDFRQEEPSVVLARAWEQAFAASSVRSSANLAFTVTPAGEGSPATVSLALSGTYAWSDIAASDSETSATLVYTSPTLGTLNAAFDTREDSGTSYLMIRRMTGDAAAPGGAAVAAAVGGIVGLFGGQWIVLDDAGIEALGEVLGERAVAVGVDPTLHEVSRVARSYARTHALLEVRENLGGDRVDGVRARHYRVGFRPEVLRELLEVATAAMATPAEDESERAQMLAAFDANAGAIAEATGEVWIGKRSGDFVRLQFPVRYTARETRVVLSGTVDVRLSDWGVPFMVAAPADAVRLSDILVLFLGKGAGPLGGLTPSSARLERVDGTTTPDAASLRAGDGANRDGASFPGGGDPDGDGLENLQEAFYGSSPTNADTDGDGYTDGDEVENGYSPTGTGRLFANPLAR